MSIVYTRYFRMPHGNDYTVDSFYVHFSLHKMNKFSSFGIIQKQFELHLLMCHIFIKFLFFFSFRFLLGFYAFDSRFAEKQNMCALKIAHKLGSFFETRHRTHFYRTFAHIFVDYFSVKQNIFFVSFCFDWIRFCRWCWWKYRNATCPRFIFWKPNGVSLQKYCSHDFCTLLISSIFSFRRLVFTISSFCNGIGLSWTERKDAFKL